MPTCGSARSASRLSRPRAPTTVTLAVLPLVFDYGQNQLLSTWYAGGCVVPLDYLTAARRDEGGRRVTTSPRSPRVPPLWVQLIEQDWPRRGARQAAPADQQRRRADARSGAAAARAVPAGAAVRDVRADRGVPLDLPRSRAGRQPPDFDGQGDPLRRDPGGRRRRRGRGRRTRRANWSTAGRWSRRAIGTTPARTAERFKPAPAGSRYGGMAVWSGDRVRRDAEGLLYFVGRRDAMIKSAGNRISPQEIEEAALATGLVAEAVALGVPDERLGQAVAPDRARRAAAPTRRTDCRASSCSELPNFMQPAGDSLARGDADQPQRQARPHRRCRRSWRHEAARADPAGYRRRSTASWRSAAARRARWSTRPAARRCSSIRPTLIRGRVASLARGDAAAARATLCRKSKSLSRRFSN